MRTKHKINTNETEVQKRNNVKNEKIYKKHETKIQFCSFESNENIDF